MSSVLRQRNFALLWSGLTVSELGNAVTFVVLPLIAVLVLHASAFQVGLIAAAGSVPWLVVALPAGVWVDRWPRRPVMIVSDLARAVVMASIPVAWWLGRLTVAQLAVVSLLTGVGTVFFSIANTAFMPVVLPADRLHEGNGALQASMSATAIAGPGLGGLLIQVIGGPVTLLVDAVSFLVSAGTVAAMRTVEPLRVAPAGGERRLLAEIRDGLRYLAVSPLPRTIALGAGLCNFALGGFDTVVVVFLVRQLHLTAGTVGLLLATMSVGGLIGSLVAARVSRRFGSARTPVLMAYGIVPAGLLVPLTTAGLGLAWFVAGSVLATACIGVFNVCVLSAMQTHVPGHLLGRVSASMRVFSRGTLPLGALLGGALADAFAPRWALLVMMALLIPIPLAFQLSPLGRVREISELTPAEITPGASTLAA